MSVLQKLTEGIQTRNLQQEGNALLEKWERTGLLEGIGDEHKRQGMARLLENQAAQLLRETSTMSGGDVEGFASVAFPIVRRVFGGLIANDLVSVQPMSLPSGLIFFLDFTVNTPKLGYAQDSSLFGGGIVGSQLTGGVDLAANPEAGPYNLNNGYASPTGTLVQPLNGTLSVVASGAVGGAAATSLGGTFVGLTQAQQDALDKACQYDPDLSGSLAVVVTMTGSSAGNFEQFNVDNLVSLTMNSGSSTALVSATANLVRRLTTISSGSTGNNPSQANWAAELVFTQRSGSTTMDNLITAIGGTTPAGTNLQLDFGIDDNFIDGGAVGSVIGSAVWELENNNNIPEIDIKVDSVAVTAMTKKLKAKWTPELGQDLNAYHNLDAEVELTSILSEQIALEIDQEILEDLIKGAKAGTQYWSRSPGLFVNRTTGS